MASKKKRRRYSPEFKVEAVKLVLERGLSRADAARDLSVPESVLCRWVQKALAAQAGDSLDTADRAELARLRRENATLRKERDILKKAAAFFAKETL